MSIHRVFFVFLKLIIFLYGLNTSFAQLTSFRIENVESLSSVSSDGQLTLFVEDTITIRIFSNKQINSRSQISFTNVVDSIGSDCDDLRKSDICNMHSVVNNTALVQVIFTKSDAMLDGDLMFCYRSEEVDDPSKKTNWVHQGNNSWMKISLQIKDDHMSVVMVWVKSVLIPVFLLLSAIFSGLSLTLLSLTRAELKVLRNQGKSEEKRYSKVVGPLRKRGNILFCGLLLMNILANVVVVVLLYELIQLYSILAATVLIVFLGELVPQTICSKYGLAFGNKMSWLTDVFFVLTLPFSYPVGKIMDLILDDEVPAVYNRDRFQEILARPGKSLDPAGITSTNPVVSEEIKPFRLSNRTVGDVMVKLEEAYMEEYDSILTSEKVMQILKKGYTRIPVYEKERSNVVALLHIRDLTLIDPKDQLTLKAVCKFYNRPVNFVFEDTKLTVMLEEFKKGQSHMAFVQRVNSDGPGDPYYETLGMITLEDVIEDIFHSDSVASRQLVASTFDPQIHFQNSKINSDMERLKFNQYLSLHRKQRSDDESHVESLPSNLLEAVQHFLPTVPAFHPDLISQSVLNRLLNQCSIMKVKGTNRDSLSSCETQDKSDKIQPIVEKDRPMDFFVLVLEGKVKVTIGVDSMKFVEGSFTHFGHPVLMKALPDLKLLPIHFQRTNQNPPTLCDQSEYVPDFSVHPIREVHYLKMPLSVYLSSLQATQLQRMNNRVDSSSDVSVTLSSHADNHHHHRAMQIGGYMDGDNFVEVNNAKNSYLNYQGYPDLYPPNYDVVSPDYPFRLLGDSNSWAFQRPRGEANLSGGMLQTMSPSDEWLDRHCKGDADSSRSQDLVSDRSTVADDVLPRCHSFADDNEMDKKGC